MNMLDYLDGIIELRPKLKHPKLHIVAIKENTKDYRLLFYKHDKVVNNKAINLFRLRYEHQQKIKKGINLNLMFGSNIRVLNATRKQIKEEFQKLEYTLEFV